jgi:hypothetical protein
MPAHVVFFYFLLLASCGYALVKGGRPERQVAAMLVAATLLSKLAAWNELGHFVEFETRLFLIDVALLGGLGAIALTSDRYWPIWLTTLHAYTVVAHLGRLVVPDTIFHVYVVNSAITSHPVVLLVAVGTWRHRKRIAAGACES